MRSHAGCTTIPVSLHRGHLGCNFVHAGCKQGHVGCKHAGLRPGGMKRLQKANDEEKCLMKHRGVVFVCVAASACVRWRRTGVRKLEGGPRQISASDAGGENRSRCLMSSRNSPICACVFVTLLQRKRADCMSISCRK